MNGQLSLEALSILALFLLIFASVLGILGNLQTGIQSVTQNVTDSIEVESFEILVGSVQYLGVPFVIKNPLNYSVKIINGKLVTPSAEFNTTIKLVGEAYVTYARASRN